MSANRISNKAVQNATGKNWEKWFKILDKEGSTSKSHKEIAGWLKNNFNISGWWSQMITVQYERDRGMRQLHERKDGFVAGKTKTFHVPVKKLYRAWFDPSQRRQWMENPDFNIRSATKNNSIRIIWPDKTNVTVYFAVKGENKTQISIQHTRLKSKEEVSHYKIYWHTQLTNLGAHLR